MNRTIESILEKIDENTLIISDTHLGHKSILNFEPCRGTAMRIDGFEDHDEWIIHNWNSVVGPDDVVLCLGDFAFSNVANYSNMLNGFKIIVLGNHDDKPNKQKWVEGGWHVIDGFYTELHGLTFKLEHSDAMFSGFVKDLNGVRYLFSHYPVFDVDEWDRKNKMIAPRIEKFEELYTRFRCNKSVHGHIHSNVSAFEDSINVSFEHLDFKPKRFGDLVCK